jgi:hypothetical protein
MYWRCPGDGEQQPLKPLTLQQLAPPILLKPGAIAVSPGHFSPPRDHQGIDELSAGQCERWQVSSGWDIHYT